MAQLKTKPTHKSVTDFIETILDEKRKNDCKAILSVYQKAGRCGSEGIERIAGEVNQTDGRSTRRQVKINSASPPPAGKICNPLRLNFIQPAIYAHEFSDVHDVVAGFGKAHRLQEEIRVVSCDPFPFYGVAPTAVISR